MLVQKKGPDKNQALPKLTIKKTHLNFATPKIGRILLLCVNRKLMILNNFRWEEVPDRYAMLIEENHSCHSLYVQKKAPARNCRGLPFNLYSVL
jgi:hypothetical protein